MDLDLHGRTAVVTGASRGIGLAIVGRLLEEGMRVVAVARHAPDDPPAGDVTFVPADLSTADGPLALADVVGDHLDVLVNNVGSAPPRPGGFASIDDAAWQSTLDLNLLAAVRVTRALVGRMSSGASIVNVVSENAMLADPLVMDYSAAKAALLSWTKSLSKELGPAGVRVNSISPGPVATDLWLGHGGVAETVSAASGATADDVRRGAEQSMVTGRFTQPAEVADLAAVVASPRFPNLTGADVVIDGGLRQTM